MITAEAAQGLKTAYPVEANQLKAAGRGSVHFAEKVKVRQILHVFQPEKLQMQIAKRGDRKAAVDFQGVQIQTVQRAPVRKPRAVVDLKHALPRGAKGGELFQPLKRTE